MTRARTPEPPPTPRVLDLREASAAHDLSPSLWTSWCEAAAVTCDRVHRGAPPNAYVLCPAGRTDIEASLAWTTPDDRMKRSHANTIDATEMGAYAVATLAVNAIDGWRVVARTPTESGADLWMVGADDPPDAQVRLEVSGVAKGKGVAGITALRTRLEQKIAQVKRGRATEPGVAAVVGFELARVLVSEVAAR